MFATACKKQTQKPISEEEIRRTEEALIEVNRMLVNQDQEKIKAYVDESGWNMNVTETGLWYGIYENGNGVKAETGMTVSLEYKLSLIDGRILYTSESMGPKIFRIGQGGVESGLEEAILFLREGDRARLILPPHLAHGLTGDGNKIPARAIIVYDIKVLKLSS